MFCQTIFMKFKLCGWSFVRLSYEYQTVKAKFCQFKSWMLYCTNRVWTRQVVQDKKIYLWLDSICFVQMLYKPEFIQSIWHSSAVEGFTFFRLPPREAVRKVSNAPFCTAVDIPHLGASHMKLLNTRVQLGVYPFLLGMSVTSLCIPLGSNPAWQWSLKISLIFLLISPVDWTNFWLKTATFEILINDKFLPELPSLAALFETQITSNETWAWQYQTASTELMRTYLSSTFTNWDELRHRKLSFSYISNCLNRGTDLNRLLISLSHYLKYSNKL